MYNNQTPISLETFLHRVLAHKSWIDDIQNPVIYSDVTWHKRFEDNIPKETTFLKKTTFLKDSMEL